MSSTNFFKKITKGFQEHLSLAIKLILLLSILSSIRNQLWHIMSTSIFLFILMFVPQITKKYDVEIPKTFRWILFIFVIITLFLGKVGGIVVPIVFGITIALIGFMILAILYSSNQIKKNYFLIILFSFNFALALGAILEILKYYLKTILGHPLSVEIYSYSIKSMSFVLMGATISAICGFIYMKGYKGIIRNLANKFIKLNPKLSTKKAEEEILDLIRKGESEKIEFKSSLRMNLYTNQIDRKIENAVLKTIVAFLNSNGGNLLIGVSNKGEILGIENDKFENKDKFGLHLSNLIKEKIGKRYLHLINFEIVSIKGKTIAKVNCKQSDKQIFFKPTSKEEEFYIRVGPSNTEIKGSELIEYVSKKFGKK